MGGVLIGLVECHFQIGSVGFFKRSPQSLANSGHYYAEDSIAIIEY